MSTLLRIERGKRPQAGRNLRGRAREIGADRLPALAAVQRLEDDVRTQVEHARVDRREHHGQGAHPAILSHAHRLGGDILHLPGAPVEARDLFGAPILARFVGVLSSGPRRAPRTPRHASNCTSPGGPMPQSLKSQTALVTGAASGIGAGVARTLGAAGAAVVINYVTNPAAAEAVAAEIRADVSRAAGKIVCISSVHEVIPWAGHANYAASKGGVKLLMQSLAQELAPHRIRVNSVAPGAIQTPINRAAWETPEALASLLR